MQPMHLVITGCRREGLIIMHGLNVCWQMSTPCWEILAQLYSMAIAVCNSSKNIHRALQTGIAPSHTTVSPVRPLLRANWMKPDNYATRPGNSARQSLVPRNARCFSDGLHPVTGTVSASLKAFNSIPCSSAPKMGGFRHPTAMSGFAIQFCRRKNTPSKERSNQVQTRA